MNLTDWRLTSRIGGLAVLATAGLLALGCPASTPSAPPAADAAPQTVTLPASRDATLVESADGSLANGQGTGIFVGRTGQPRDSRRRGLVAFDLGELPRGATVVSAQLVMELNHTHAGAEPIRLHRVTAEWSEGPADTPGGRGAPAQPGDVTWIHRSSPDKLWDTAGGDFEPAPSATSSPGGPGSYTWGPSDAMRADVQQWLERPASNQGWLLLGNEESSGTAKRFQSAETGDTGPRLTVTYRPGSR